MLVEITKNKYAKKAINPNILGMFRQFFIENKDRWYKGEQIEYMIGKSSCRIYINKLRCEGMPIVSDVKKGYKYTTNKDEVRKCYDQLRERALIALTSAKLMRRFM